MFPVRTEFIPLDANNISPKKLSEIYNWLLDNLEEVEWCFRTKKPEIYESIKALKWLYDISYQADEFWGIKVSDFSWREIYTIDYIIFTDLKFNFIEKELFIKADLMSEYEGILTPPKTRKSPVAWAEEEVKDTVWELL